MFGKLIKNEFRNTWKMMGMINGALVVMHLIMMIFTDVLQDKIMTSVFWRNTYNIYSGTYMVSLIGIQFAVFILFSTRYFKKVYSDQGYLTHTLPVRKSFITGAMVISAAFWSIVTLLVSASYPYIKAMNEFRSVFGSLELSRMLDLAKEQDVTWYTFTSMIVMGISAVVCYYVLMFFSITVGQNWKKHPLLGSVIVFWLSHTILQVVGLSALVNLVESEIISRAWIDSVTSTFGRAVNTATTIANILAIVLITIGLVVNNFIMRKRLNL